MFRVLICLCWQTENKNMSRISVRHCSKCLKSSLKNIQATRKRVIFCEAQSIERFGLTDRKFQKNNFCRILNQAQARENV